MSTSRGTWKNFERRVAALFGTVRTPLSGSNSGHHTNSDSLHKEVYIEAKYRQSFSVVPIYMDTKEKAAKENKIPVVALKQKGMNGFLLLLAPEDLLKIAKYVKIDDAEQ